MAKRFIETGLFRKKFVRGLQGAYKTLFIYYITECDHAGLWDLSNLDIDSILLGSDFTEEGIMNEFKGNAIFIDGKMFMRGFIEYQYGNTLNEGNRVHKSVIDKLESVGIDPITLDVIKPLTRPLQGCKDKDKDIDKDKDKDIPSESEFIQYLVSKLPERNPEWTQDRATRAAKARYETYTADGWKDGKGNKIKIWKTKALNAINYEKPWSYGSANPPNQPQAKSFQQQNQEAKEAEYQRNMRSVI